MNVSISIIQINPYVSPCTKVMLKWIKDLNIKHVTLNQLEEKVWNCLEFIKRGNNFLTRTLVEQEIRTTVNKWNLMKLKSFCRILAIGQKKKTIEWEKTFTNSAYDRGLISQI